MSTPQLEEKAEKADAVSKHFAAIVLAAGYSSRMGAFKPLLPLGEMTVTERVVCTLRQAGIRDIRVVVGYRSAEMISLLERLEVKAVVNTHYADGMLSSAVTGVRDILRGARDRQGQQNSPTAHLGALFLWPVDIPLVRARTLGRLVAAQQESGASVVYPKAHGIRGHPPLMESALLACIPEWSGADGLRGLLAQYEASSVSVDVDDEGVLFDMDTPEDYVRARRLAEEPKVPSARTCKLLLEERFGADSPVIMHSEAVSRLAVAIAERLNQRTEQGERCRNLDIGLLRAAALLHDIGKGQKDHALSGAAYLYSMGYGDVGLLVAAHIDPPQHDSNMISEADILSLADKLIQEARLVPLEARFGPRLERYGADPAVREKIEARFAAALACKARVEACLGMPVGELWETAEQGE